MIFTESAVGDDIGQQGCGGLEWEKRAAESNARPPSLLAVLVATSHAPAGTCPDGERLLAGLAINLRGSRLIG